MIGIIFNKANIADVKEFLEIVKPKDEENLIFVVVDDNIFFQLNKSVDKKKILGHDHFISSIQYSRCGKFDPDTNTIFLTSCDDIWVETLIKSIQSYFEASVNIVLPSTDILEKSGFSMPHPCVWDESKTCLVRSNTHLSEQEKRNTFFENMWLKSQTHAKYCSISLTIDRESIDFLKFLTTHGGVTFKNGTRSQKEVSGHFHIVKTEILNGQVTHTLKVRKDDIVYGDEVEINMNGSLYTFHSHPIHAYKIYNTKYGVPSAADYWAVYTLCKTIRAIVHFVAALEGLYVISCIPDSTIFLNFPKKKVKKLIWKNLKLHADTHVHDLPKYIEKVNNLGLFKLSLIPWDEIEGRNITVSFNKHQKMCLFHNDEFIQ